jgi:8-oxo-dGTP pyrophosphatase MutT (NUDIX family)
MSDLIKDKVVPIVVVAVIDLVGIGSTGPRVLLLRRSEKVEYLQGHWSMVTGTIDNWIYTRDGVSRAAIIFQSHLEIASKIGIFSEHLSIAKLVKKYSRRDRSNGEVEDTRLVAVETNSLRVVFTSWEHDQFKWLSIQRILEHFSRYRRYKVLENILLKCAPNLRRDLRKLIPHFNRLYKDWKTANGK